MKSSIMHQKLKPIIKIQDLSKKYNKKVAVDNINLEIPESCFALLGIMELLIIIENVRINPVIIFIAGIYTSFLFIFAHIFFEMLFLSKYSIIY